MNILFINPPSENEIIGNDPEIIKEEQGFYPPLGILYIASYMEKSTKHKVEILDAQAEKIGYPEMEKIIQSKNPDIVGITAMTMTMVDVLNTANIVKEIDDAIRVVLGGPHVNLFPDETIRLKNVDYLVLGEGEAIFADLINAIDEKTELGKIIGLVFEDNGEIINTGQRPLISNLDELPFPARHLVPYKKYTSLLSKGGVVTTVFTSRGCPFKCSFCDRPHLGKIFRARSSVNVVDELEACTKLGIYEFQIYDDTFTVNKRRVIDICNEIIRRKLNIGWDIRARVDTVNEEVIAHLKKAGCQGIHYGVEAGTDKILKILNKGITINQVKEVFNLTRKYRIPILAYFMIGSPKETLEDIYQTFKVMKDLNPDYVHLTILTPFPGTKIYFDGLKNGVIKKDYWKEFAKKPTSNFVPPHWAEIFTRDELHELLVKGYKSFYFRPSYIFKRIRALRSFDEFRKKAVAAAKVLVMQ
jgi:radical SAM superfamily enzyme YgiQ (UPF0313 family)